MKKNKTFKKANIFFTFILYVLLVAAVIYLMKHVQMLLNSDTEVNLMEIVLQNEEVITSKLTLELNNLKNTAARISEELPAGKKVEGQKIKDAFLGLYNGNERVFVADNSGNAYFSDGIKINISGRKYYKLSMEGAQNISDKLISRKDGMDVFVISVPVYHGEHVIGTIQKSFSSDEMYEICSISVFSSKGFAYIINSEGYVVLHNKHQNCQQQSDNFLRDLYAQGNRKGSECLQKDIKNNKSGFIESNVNNEKIFSAYTPIDQIHDWYLITSVPVNAVSKNAAAVIQLFYIILMTVTFVFASIQIYFLWYKNRQQAYVEKIAFVDAVTQGNTYGKFMMEAEKKLWEHKEKSFAILKFDVDNFRYINSYYGFAFGDKMLCHIYNKLCQQLKGDEIAARISGDNFVALLEEFSQERISEMISNFYSREASIYISAGVYIINNKQDSISLMVDKASTAARSIKGKLNKNVEVYSEQFDETTMQREKLKREVTRAISKDEILPFYQPKVNISTGKVEGAEALARWITCDNQIVSPAEFVPMCEDTGLILDIDMIIFEKVLQFLKTRIDNGEPCIPISVNFSRLHLLEENFLDRLDQRTRIYEVPPEYIELEITESAMFNHMDIIHDFVTAIKERGFMVSMDDFGSGYSSLNMLMDIPIDVLKIDREFLKETVHHSRRDIIFKSIVEMANNLEIKIIVEGVENEENVNLMRKSGCDIAQGYFFAKPMSPETFIEYLGRSIL